MTTRPTAEPSTETGTAAAEPPRRLTPEAERALAEAAERRRLAETASQEQPREVGGRDGPDPARYGDWEKAGIVSDF